MRYLMRFSYDGTLFYGYQKQIDKRTVQGEIESVLNKITNSNIVISASGRTDALVHANNQYAHFDYDKAIDLDKFKYSLNCLLPDDIYIKSISLVSNEFHARYDVLEKTYIYKLNIGEYSPMDRNYIYQYNKSLDIDNMKLAIKKFVGVHNFKSFTTNNPKIKDYNREIYEANISVENNILIFKFRGNGFLQYMVRNMVGFLIEVGCGKRNYNDVVSVLKSEDRTKAGIMASGCGLYLDNVIYKK